MSQWIKKSALGGLLVTSLVTGFLSACGSDGGSKSNNNNGAPIVCTNPSDPRCQGVTRNITVQARYTGNFEIVDEDPWIEYLAQFAIQCPDKFYVLFWSWDVDFFCQMFDQNSATITLNLGGSTLPINGYLTIGPRNFAGTSSGRQITQPLFLQAYDNNSAMRHQGQGNFGTPSFNDSVVVTIYGKPGDQQLRLVYHYGGQEMGRAFLYKSAGGFIPYF